MSVQTTAGSTLALSSNLPADPTSGASFGAVTGFTTVGEVTDLGEATTRDYNTVSHNPIASRRVVKLKGSFNNGTLSVQFGRDFADAGQTAFKTALNSDAAYSFKIVLQSGKILYFTGLVMSFKTNLGGVDQVAAAAANIELLSDVIEV